MAYFINDLSSNNKRYLGAKAKLARQVAIEEKYPELKRELLFQKEFMAGNWCPDKSKIPSTISKLDALRIILSFSEFEMKTLIAFGIMPELGGEQ